MKTLIVCCLLLGVGVFSAKLPEYLKKCKKGPGHEKCVADNGNAVVRALSKEGEPKFKLQNLSPVHIEKIDLQATPQLKVIINNVDMFGFENFVFKSGEITDKELVLHSHMDRMELVGDYDINGQILILPIKGDGRCNITMVDFDVEVRAKFATEERKGKTYLKLEANENTVLTMNNMKRVYWQFDNLFNGDERLGPEMNKFLNDNWEDVYKEVKVGMEQTSAYSIMNYFANGYLHYIPIDELFDES